MEAGLPPRDKEGLNLATANGYNASTSAQWMPSLVGMAGGGANSLGLVECRVPLYPTDDNLQFDPYVSRFDDGTLVRRFSHAPYPYSGVSSGFSSLAESSIRPQMPIEGDASTFTYKQSTVPFFDPIYSSQPQLEQHVANSLQKFQWPSQNWTAKPPAAGYYSAHATPENEEPDFFDNSRTSSFSTTGGPITPFESISLPNETYFGSGHYENEQHDHKGRAYQQEAASLRNGINIGQLQLYSPPTLNPATFNDAPSLYFSNPQQSQPETQGASGQQQLIRRFLMEPNKLALGTQTVLLFCGKLAQRSYNAEKRFLSPPPFLLAMGWTGDSVDGVANIVHCDGSIPTFIDSALIDKSGGERWTHRLYAKQAFVPANAETNRSAVAAMTLSDVVRSNGADMTGIHRYYGQVMTTISKPAKRKSPSKMANFHVTHGSLVCIGNRQRSQVASMRYLCGTDEQAYAPVAEWNMMTGQSMDFQQDETPWESQQTTNPAVWDPYINAANSRTRPHPDPTFPPIPAIAISYDANAPQAIHCNQTIILQSHSTGKLSPIFVIRDVKEKERKAYGIDAIPGYNFDERNRDYATPGEVLGDPVSHLQKVAFQLLGNTTTVFQARRTDSRDFLGYNGTAVACTPLDGANRRTYTVRQRSDSASTSVSPPMSTCSSFADVREAASPYASPMVSAPSQFSPARAFASPRHRQLSMSSTSPADQSAHGGKVPKRRRNGSNAGALPVALTSSVLGRGHGSRRTSLSVSMSMSTLEEARANEPEILPAVLGPDEELTETYSINIDLGFVWSISGVSYARYTTVPSSVPETREEEPYVAQFMRRNEAADLNFPSSPAGVDWIVLCGHGLDNNLQVWFDDIQAVITVEDGPYQLFAALPSFGGNSAPKRIILTTSNDTLYPTDQYVRPEF